MYVARFHCEINTIEGVWCYEKEFVRKYSDQTFNKMLQLIPQAKANFIENNIFNQIVSSFLENNKCLRTRTKLC